MWITLDNNIQKMLNTQAVILVGRLIPEGVGYLIKQNSIGASKKSTNLKCS